MSGQGKTKLGIFQQAAARPQRAFAVEIDVNDVRAVRPDWSEERAIAFLQQHSQRIADQMMETGMTAVIALAIGGDDVN